MHRTFCLLLPLISPKDIYRLHFIPRGWILRVNAATILVDYVLKHAGTTHQLLSFQLHTRIRLTQPSENL